MRYNIYSYVGCMPVSCSRDHIFWIKEQPILAFNIKSILNCFYCKLKWSFIFQRLTNLKNIKKKEFISKKKNAYNLEKAYIYMRFSSMVAESMFCYIYAVFYN